MDRSIRVGLVGCGAQGRAHLAALRGLDGDLVTVTGLCDLDESRLAVVAPDWPEARTSRDFTGLLAHEDLDLVFLCTMPNSHARIAVAALQAGAHVLIEKPMAMNAVEAETILDVAEQAQRQVQVGTNMRYLPHAQYLRHAFVDGRIGAPRQARVWASHRRPPVAAPHYNRATAGGGLLAATLVHTLDLALWVCGYPQPVTVTASTYGQVPDKRGALIDAEVQARYDVEDLLAAHIRFANGLVMQVDGNWCDDVGERLGFEVVGARGTLRSSPFEIYTEGPDGTVIGETPELAATEFARRRLPRVTSTDDDLGGWGRSLQEQAADLIACLRSGEPWTMQSRQQQLTLQRLIDTCYESARAGREVVLECHGRDGVDR